MPIALRRALICGALCAAAGTVVAGSLWLLLPPSHALLFDGNGSAAQCHALSFSADETVFAAIHGSVSGNSRSYHMRIWRASSLRLVAEVEIGTSPAPIDLALSFSGQQAAVLFADGAIECLENAGLPKRRTLRLETWRYWGEAGIFGEGCSPLVMYDGRDRLVEIGSISEPSIFDMPPLDVIDLESKRVVVHLEGQGRYFGSRSFPRAFS